MGKKAASDKEARKISKKRASPASLAPLVETEATNEALPATITNWDGTNINGSPIAARTFNGGTTNSTEITSSSSHGSLPANSIHDSSSTASSELFSGHNSEPFSLEEGCSRFAMEEGTASVGGMSVSEASSILERHIVAHPIESEDDFHYIAELLRNYENEDDLRRVAELLRAQKSPLSPTKSKKKKKKEKKKEAKKKKEKKQKAKKPKLDPRPISPLDDDDNREARANDDEYKKDSAKKPKLDPRPISPLGDDGTREVRANDDDDFDDDDDSSSSSSSSSSESSSSSSSSSDSSTGSEDMDESSSLTSSVRKVKKRKKKSKKEKKEKERRKKKQKKKKRKEKRKEAKRERRRKEKERKKKKRNEEAAEDDQESVIVPPTSIEVVKEMKDTDQQQQQDDSITHDHESTQQLNNVPKPELQQHDDDTTSRHNDDDDDDDDSGDGPNETFEDEPASEATPNSSTDADGSREVFLDEPIQDGQVAAPVVEEVGPEFFPYPGMVQGSNNDKIRGSIAISQSALDHSAQHQQPEGSTSSFDPSFPLPGTMTISPKRASLNLEDTTDSQHDSFAQDVVPDPATAAAAVPFPPGSAAAPTASMRSSAPDLLRNSLRLPTLAEYQQRASSGSGAMDKPAKPALEKIQDSFQDSWAQTGPTESWSAPKASHPPPMPTIFSNSDESSTKVQEFEDEPVKQDDSISASNTESTPDEELVNMALQRFSSDNLTSDDEESIEESLESPSASYPQLGNFQFAKNVDYTKPAVPLRKAALNASASLTLNRAVPLRKAALNASASLTLNRETSSDLLKTTLDMTRQRSGDSMLSASIARPPTFGRGNSGVVSTTSLFGSSHLSQPSSAMIQKGMVPEPPEEAAQAHMIVHQQSIQEGEIGEMIQAEFQVKPRLLCLHGWRSNAEITRLQLDNLGLLDFFDPIFIEGPHISDEPADAAVNLLSQGPYYSWVEKKSQFSDTDAGGGKLKPENRSANSRISSISSRSRKPRRIRDSIYGFGRASRKQNAGPSATDELMLSLKAVMMHLITESQYLDAFIDENEEIANIPCYDAVYGFSQGATLVTLLSYEFVRNRVLEELNLPPMQRLPWRFVISACAANTSMKELLAHHFEIEYSVQIPLPSVHIIGLSDFRKGQSEAIMKDNYNSQQAFPIYLDSGHGIPAATRKLSYVLDEIINWFLLKITLPDVDIANVPVESQSQNVSMLHIMDEIDKIQRDRLEDSSPSVDLDVGQLHLGAYGQYIVNTVDSSHSNLIEMLEDADPKKFAFLAPDAKPLTYGNFLKFIRGDGDLRKAGAQEGCTVAYVAPFGVVSATAFITVASQCPAAPLDPGYNEADYLLAFDQLQPTLVITFDGVDSGLVHRVALGQGLKVAHATVQPGTCGLFKFEVDKNPSMTQMSAFLDKSSGLVNNADNNGLILRTSGTTSKPKVVPLKLWAIVGNSRVIAKNLGLRSSDIALNAMPLFHIGGLSANLLSSLAAGASVILLPKFNAADFFDFLTSPEEPRPTWYSAVPTMHAAIHQFSEDSIFKTSLRFIRSGAAAMPHDLALKMEETFDCPLILTYSMTEQMPISQPPRGYSIARNKPNSVGQPVCSSMCIVDKNLRPVPFSSLEGEDGEKEPINGEVCISGAMILEGYVANPDANANSFFRMGGMDWFRTGDVGHLDKEGFLFLTGRSKELIKRGGDQVSPYEVEDAIYKHLDVKTVVVFAIPDPIWGERVGAAIILKDGIKHDQVQFKKVLSKMMLDDGLQPFKFPEEVVLVKEEDLPKTRSNKYIRIGLAKALGLDGKKERDQLNAMKPVNYHEAAVGVKFFLAYAVTYVHIGNFDNRDMADYAHDSGYHYQWEHTRSWCWHNPIFFLVGGFLLAAGTHVPVTTFKDLGNFYSLRIAGLHPMYLLSILFCTVNYVARCNPSNYIPDFDRLREPLPGEYFVCQATPIEWSYWPTLIVSIISYVCTLQSWPFMIPFAWSLSYYTWFSSVYIFCIFAFPWCHQQYHAVRDDISKVWKLTIFWLGMNYLYVLGISPVFFMTNDAMKNYFALSSYLFPPGWFPCCACGVGCFYLFRHYRPNEKANSWIWGTITDIISLLLLAGWLFYGLAPVASTPSFAEDDSTVARHWAPFLSRILAPVGFLWFWGLAVGTGYTSALFSIPFVAEWLAPASYNMFLFHQPVAEWYYLATRGVWWAYPKNFFWFSPYPYPVAFWEFFIVTAIVVAFSVFMEAYFNEFLVANFAACISWMGGGGLKRKHKEGESVFQVVESIIHELTYADVTMDTGLTEAGLSSMTTIILVSEIKKVYKTLKLTVRDVINSETVGELVDLIEGRMRESKSRPELALGNRTAVAAPKTLKNMMLDYSDDSNEDDKANDRQNLMAMAQGFSTRIIGSGKLGSLGSGSGKFGSLGSNFRDASATDASLKSGARRSTAPSRTKRASFVLGDSSGHSGSTARRQTAPSRRRSSRMSFTIQAANASLVRSNPAPARGMPAYSPRSFRSVSSNRSSASSRVSTRQLMGGQTISTSGVARRPTARPAGRRMSRMGFSSRMIKP